MLKKLENSLCKVVTRLHDIKRFVELFVVILPLSPFHLQDVKGHLAHLYGVQLGGPWVCCLSDKSVIISSVIRLILNYILLMLVKLRIKVEKVNTRDVNLINVLLYRVP